MRYVYMHDQSQTGILCQSVIGHFVWMVPVLANGAFDASIFPSCDVIVTDWNNAKSKEFLIQHKIAFIIDVSKIPATKNQKLLYSSLGITRAEFKIDDGIGTNKQLMSHKKYNDRKRLIHGIWETIMEYTSHRSRA